MSVSSLGVMRRRRLAAHGAPAAREEALTRPPSGAIGWFDYSFSPPPGSMLACLSCITSLMRHIHLSLLTVSHFIADAQLQFLLPGLRLVV